MSRSPGKTEDVSVPNGGIQNSTPRKVCRRKQDRTQSQEDNDSGSVQSDVDEGGIKSRLRRKSGATPKKNFGNGHFQC